MTEPTVPNDYPQSAEALECHAFAICVAYMRLSPSLHPSDLLCGAYLSQSEKLAKYWKDVGGFERLMSSESDLGDCVRALKRAMSSSDKSRTPNRGSFSSSLTRQKWWRS